MRIIGGQFRGKKLVAAPEQITRPTLDRAKESLFNILESWLLKSGKHWSEQVWTDVFAGSGAIGIEALSRGAKHVIFFENHPIARRFLMMNLKNLANVSFQLQTDALLPMPRQQAVDVLFMDPPYHQGLIERTCVAFYQAGWIGKETIVIMESDAKETICLPPFLTILRTVRYGRNQFLFAQLKTETGYESNASI